MQGRLAPERRACEEGALGEAAAHALEPHRQHVAQAVERLDDVAAAQAQHACQVSGLLGVERDALPDDAVGADEEAGHAAVASSSREDQPSTTSRPSGAKPAASSAAITLWSSCSRMPPRISVPPGAVSRR